MGEEKNRIKSFTDLSAWKEGHKLVLMTYRVTGNFPDKEKFGLVSQMQRCAISITSNVAEGFSRQGKKEKVQFYYISLSSISELQNQLLIARDVDYLNSKEFKKIAKQTTIVQKIINGLIKSIKNRK